MPAITIPKKFVKDDLVVIPKREYEEFSRWKKNIKVRLDERWFWTPEWQRKEAEADQDITKGRISGPFVSARDLIKHLRKNKIRFRKHANPHD